jgi:hypothetical protein
MAASPQKWALTEHRPPVVFRKALPRLRVCKIMDSKIIYLGHAQQADRVVWVPVPSESDSAPPVVEKWVKRGRSPSKPSTPVFIAGPLTFKGSVPRIDAF